MIRRLLAGAAASALALGGAGWQARADTAQESFTLTVAQPVSRAPLPITPVFAIITSFTAYTGPFPFFTGAFRVGTPGAYTFTLNSPGVSNGLYILNGTFSPSTGTPSTPLSNFIVFSQQLTNTVIPNISLTAGAQYSYLNIFSIGNSPVTLTIAGPGCISFTGMCYDNGINVTQNIVLDGTVADFATASGVTGLQTGIVSETGGPRSLVKTGTGTLILNGTNSYTGATTVSAGTLLVNGSIATSSGVTVNPGATIGGVGILPRSVVNGTLAPGNNSIGTITINGNLALGAGSLYLAEVASALADRTTVTGNATLNGTLRLVPVGALSGFARHTLLSAAGGLSGTFQTVDNQLGSSIRSTLSYDANNLFLTLSPLALTPTLDTGSPSQNQRAVALGIDSGVAAGGDANFLFSLYALPAESLPLALSQLSGEVHSGAQGLGVLVSGQFLQAMLNPNAFGRAPGANPALAYAPAGALDGLPGVVAATQAADLATGVEVVDARRFALWAAAFGSDGRIGGDAGIGSVRRSERSSGIAAGVDWRVAPGAIIGVALAGGGANASLDNGLGSASAEVFQAGAYAMARFGGFDLSAALAYSRLEIDTTRSIPFLGLAAVNGSYDAEVWSGRIEAAMPIAFAGLSVAPLAALQAQSVRTPSFVETVPGGATDAALAIDGRTSTTTRGEIGARIEQRFALGGMGATAFARLAWAHYFERDATVTAAFVGLPGSTFSVIGARPDRDSALISAGLDLRLTPQLSIGARFDGEFSQNVSQYAGTARIRFEF